MYTKTLFILSNVDVDDRRYSTRNSIQFLTNTVKLYLSSGWDFSYCTFYIF